MGRPCDVALVTLLIMSLLSTESAWAKRKGGSTSPSSTKTQSKTQAGSYPRQPQTPNRNPNPYPAGGSYPHPGRGGTNQGGYPNQKPAAGYPNQKPAAGYPNQNPAGGAGSYPGAGGNPNQYPGRANPGGYPNQNPAAGGYPNQYPGRGNYPNQYPAGGSYPNQYPGRGGVNPGGYPNQYPGGYPAAGGYPVRGGNTGQGWGAPGANPGGYPGGYPGGGMGGQPNWNPNNAILSPRYGGGGYGYGGGHGMGGSPFSRSVQSMGHQPSMQSQGFAKKAMMAAGVGAVAGMALGYGLGRFPRPHFNFRNPEEEQYYNNYMYKRYGTQSTDEKDYGRDYVYSPPPRAQSYDKFMDNCMNKTEPPKDQGGSSPQTLTPAPGANQDSDDTVSIEEIGYPALIEQVKARRCVERYMNYSERFLQKRTAEKQQQQVPSSRGGSLSDGPTQLFTSLLVLLSSVLLLQ